MRRSLLLTFDFPPVVSGISTVFYNIWKQYDSERMKVLTVRVNGDRDFDRAAAFHPVRFRTPRRGKIGKLASVLIMFLRTAWYVMFCGVREIHAGQILSCGPIGLIFQKITGIPCFLWVYGGETTDAYRRSRMEERLVRTLLRSSRYLITNSPGTTREFLDYGIPEERIIEIIPGVDAGLFTPGPRPQYLVDKYDLTGKRALLTVARITMRKGHDLVLRALDLMKDRTDIQYIIVGTGEDRGRLEESIGRMGLENRVTFTDRVDDRDLPDYYRLCDVYVMPNREVTGSTDSIEGFGISFIEANACGKPVIGGRSGGTDAAVADGVTGFLVNPEEPHEFAEKLRYLLDRPEKAAEMGMNGRERVLDEFSWEEQARKLAGYLTVDPHDTEDGLAYSTKRGMSEGHGDRF